VPPGSFFGIHIAQVFIGCNGMPHIHPKTAPSPSKISTHLIHPSFDRLHLPPQTASRSNQPFFHNSPTWQTAKQTDRDRPTDGIGDKPVPTPAYALLYCIIATRIYMCSYYHWIILESVSKHLLTHRRRVCVINWIHLHRPTVLPRHAASLAALARSWWRHNKYVLYVLRSSSKTLTVDLDFQFQTS